MKNVSEDLTRIESLLDEAEHALKNDDGGRWPPAPRPPKNRRDWAKDNGNGVDPDNDDSCKEYVLRVLPVRPVLPPGSFARDTSDFIAKRLFRYPNQWVKWERVRGVASSDNQYTSLCLDVNKCASRYGMMIELKRSRRSLWLRYSGVDTSEIDSRPMTHAQRVAECRLLECHPLLHNTCQSVVKKSQEIRWIEREAERGFENQIATRFVREVVDPVGWLILCRRRFNALSARLHRRPERRLLQKGYRLHLGDFGHIVYPWGAMTRRVDSITLLDIVAGRSPEVRQCGHQWVTDEIQRWERFKAAWGRA